MRKISSRLLAAVSAAVISCTAVPSAVYAETSIQDLFDVKQGTAVSSQGCSLSMPVLRRNTGGDGMSLTPTADYTPVSRNTWAGEENFPSAFDMRGVFSTTEVKDQDAFGTCWAHAAIESLISTFQSSIRLITPTTAMMSFSFSIRPPRRYSMKAERREWYQTSGRSG